MKKQTQLKQPKLIQSSRNLLIRKFLCAHWNFGIQNKKQSQSNLFCIRNLKYYSYGIVNSKGLSKLNIINAIIYF